MPEIRNYDDVLFEDIIKIIKSENGIGIHTPKKKKKKRKKKKVDIYDDGFLDLSGDNLFD